jgi:outer membrane PBP1 activator LpoA protein
MSPRFPIGVATTYNPGSNAASRDPFRGVPEPAASLEMSRLNAVLLVALVAWAGSAFSDDVPSGTTTRATIVPPRDAPDAAGTSETTRARIIGNPPAPQDDIDPATGISRSSTVRPLRDAPAAPNPIPLTPRVAGGGPPFVALILPTQSATLGKLADALRQGFQAAAEVDARNAPPVKLIAVDNDGPALIEACRGARNAGAVLVVGAITRDGATALAHSDCAAGATLELNEPQRTPQDALPNLYDVSLSLDNEARQVAQQAVSDGWHRAVVIATASPLARRVQDAFEREWIRAAGELQRIPYSGDPESAPSVRERLAGMRADMVFLAMDAQDARTVRPFVGGEVATYATSLSVNPRADPVVNLDLEGIRYLEMPWFVQPDHPAVMAYPAPKSPMSVDEERLYAFGIDACRLALLLLHGEARRTALDGVTGRITLQGNTFVRALIPVQLDAGHVVPIKAP